MTISKTKNFFKTHRKELLPWMAVGLFVFGYYGYKKGFLLAYLNVAGYATFSITLFVTYLVCSHLLELQRITLGRDNTTDLLTRLSRQKESVSLVIRLMKYADNSLLRTVFALATFFLIYYLVLSANNYLLISFSDLPHHVLFPCSESIVMTPEMEREAMDFYGKKYHSDFGCDYYSYEKDDKW